MNPDDLQKELDRLWERVTNASPGDVEPPAPFIPSDAPSITREVSLEAIALLKRQHRSELARLQQLVEFKERTVRELSDRLATAESELAGLRRKSIRDEERIYQEVFDVSVNLEAAQKALQEQEARFRDEEKVLRTIAEETRRQLAAEASRWRELERQWNEREQQYLLELKELQVLAQKAQGEAGRESGLARKALSDLQQAKTAIEKTLAELLKERQERAASDTQKDKAVARVKEVEEHLRALQNMWEEERKQWQELWDRERSTWETQRQEFAAWEAKVRKEREEWHANLRQIEERETRYAGQMTELLRKTSDAGEKVAALLMRAAAAPQQAIRSATDFLPRVSARRASGLVAAALLLAAYPVWRHFHRLVLAPVSTAALPVDNPTALAFDGSALWVSAWSGSFSSVDPESPSKALSTAKVSGEEPYHPVSMAVWGDALYSLDAAQGRILKHSGAKPAKVLSRWATPGPAPVALAHDGQNLWSYDAVTRALYRYLGDGGAQTEAYSFVEDVLPSAVAWDSDELWVYDSKGKRLMVFALSGRRLKLKASRPFEPLQSFILVRRSAGTELWALAAPSPDSSSSVLKKFRVR